MKALKNALSGKCGVYRWIHKENYLTYIGRAKNLGDRPHRHAGVHSSNNRLHALKKRDGNCKFYLAILWIAGESENVNLLNVYNVEMDYFVRPVPKDL